MWLVFTINAFMFQHSIFYLLLQSSPYFSSYVYFRNKLSVHFVRCLTIKWCRNYGTEY